MKRAEPGSPVLAGADTTGIIGLAGHGLAEPWLTWFTFPRFSPWGAFGKFAVPRTE